MMTNNGMILPGASAYVHDGWRLAEQPAMPSNYVLRSLKNARHGYKRQDHSEVFEDRCFPAFRLMTSADDVMAQLLVQS